MAKEIAWPLVTGYCCWGDSAWAVVHCLNIMGQQSHVIYRMWRHHSFVFLLLYYYTCKTQSTKTSWEWMLSVYETLNNCFLFCWMVPFLWDLKGKIQKKIALGNGVLHIGIFFLTERLWAVLSSYINFIWIWHNLNDSRCTIRWETDWAN